MTLLGTKVREIEVWFINANALPRAPLPKATKWPTRGSGTKVLVLVD